MMARQAFEASLRADSAPAECPPLLLALWYDGRGEWARAHETVQAQGGAIAAAIHAYLHRMEGDLDNARYWYGRAGRPEFVGSLADERERLLDEILAGH